LKKIQHCILSDLVKRLQTSHDPGQMNTRLRSQHTAVRISPEIWDSEGIGSQPLHSLPPVPFWAEVHSLSKISFPWNRKLLFSQKPNSFWTRAQRIFKSSCCKRRDCTGP